ncbi:hypothetical protein, partial [Segatella hominis]|uniref:hypothetical protein n=1 Tax=Segatella hominis TaxID=2518605 RepID=UPI003AAE76EB
HWKNTETCFLTDGKSSNSIIQSAITAFFNYARYKRGAAYKVRVKGGEGWVKGQLHPSPV